MATNLATALPSPRERLLEAAAELFAEHGYQAIGLRDLASHLGLQPGSLYHHIDNKQALLFELIESGLTDLVQHTSQRLKGARSPGKRLELFVRGFMEFHATQAHAMSLISREFANLDQEQRRRVVGLKEQYATLLRGIIGDTEDGTANVVIGLLFGQAHWYSAVASEAQMSEGVRRLVGFASAVRST